MFTNFYTGPTISRDSRISAHASFKTNVEKRRKVHRISNYKYSYIDLYYTFNNRSIIFTYKDITCTVNKSTTDSVTYAVTKVTE